jgi:hypothetical protein
MVWGLGRRVCGRTGGSSGGGWLEHGVYDASSGVRGHLGSSMHRSCIKRHGGGWGGEVIILDESSEQVMGCSSLSYKLRT